MNAALELARRGLGRVWPNPAVGCVLAKSGQIIGSGWTGNGGRPHAEFEALKMASGAALGATAYVTLEPCAHEGETPSCARLLAEAGVRKVIIALPDPDPRTSGRGIRMLENAGVPVTQGLFEEEARTLNRGFFLKTEAGRPFVAMKVAASADGKIAAEENVETLITGEEAHTFSHQLRASFDAILVGIGTVLADDPDLTCRLPGLEDASPVRIVLDTDLRIPEDSRLVTSAREVPLWVITQGHGFPLKFSRKGVKILPVSDIRNIKEVIELFAKKGITRLLVEGGAAVNTSFYESGLVDQVNWIQAPHMNIGASGVPAFRGLDIQSASDLEGFRMTERHDLGHDIVEILDKLD